MKYLACILIFLCIPAFTPPLISSAQQPVLRPAIISFTADVQSADQSTAAPESQQPQVTVNAVEKGEVLAALTWITTGLTDQQHLMLYAKRVDDWELLADLGTTPNGKTLQKISAPLTFGPPTFRLVIVGKNEKVLSEQYAVIPYQPASAPPKITAFNVLPTSDGQMLVSWTVENRPPTANLVFEQILPDGSATSVELPRPVLWVASSGQGPVAPKGSGLIRLRLRVVDVVTHTDYTTQEISVNAVQSTPTATPVSPTRVPVSNNVPQIVYLTADPSTGQDGGTITVRWKYTGAPGAKLLYELNPTKYTDFITDMRQLPAEGSQVFSIDDLEVSPEHSWVEFTLMLTDSSGVNPLPGPAGTAYIQTLSVPVETGIKINSFTVSPPVADRVQTVAISWDTSNTTGVKVVVATTGKKVRTQEDDLVRPSVGSLSYTLPANEYYQIGFLLEAINSHGHRISRAVTVQIRCPFTYFFDQALLDETRMTCPLTAPQNIAGAFQPFDSGLMFWRSDTHEIYVLFNDGTFWPFQDTWAEGRVLPAEEPPAGHYQPVRGFGKVWAEGDKLYRIDVRTRLGWATAPEQSYTQTMQAVAPLGADNRSLFSLPIGKAVYLDFSRRRWKYLPLRS